MVCMQPFQVDGTWPVIQAFQNYTTGEVETIQILLK